jgi:hypothetical protein
MGRKSQLVKDEGAGGRGEHEPPDDGFSSKSVIRAEPSRI